MLPTLIVRRYAVAANIKPENRLLNKQDSMTRGMPRHNHQTQDALPRHGTTVLTPSSAPHGFFDLTPYSLDDLSVSPPPLSAGVAVPLLYLRTRHAPTPTPDGARHVFTPPSNIDAKRVLEQVRCGLPFVRLELPGLTGREDADDTRPVVRLELLRRVHQDETQWSLRVY